VFTVADGVPVLDSDLWRLQRTGTLYTVTGVRPVPTARETVFDAETVERGQYAITADVEAFTATAVYIDPAERDDERRPERRAPAARDGHERAGGRAAGPAGGLDVERLLGRADRRAGAARRCDCPARRRSRRRRATRWAPATVTVL
jgi:hypothetical protein